jgi:hypothetical protein
MQLANAASPKPFETAIFIVDNINNVVSVLNSRDIEHPLSDVIGLLDDLIEMLGVIPYIDGAWNLITAASNAISVVLDALTAFTEIIPGLDVVMDVLDGIVNLIDGLEDLVDGVLDVIVTVVKDILPILRDIHTGLSDIRSLIQGMASELPALINTMKILQALAEIVEDIAPAFQKMAGESTVAKRLETVLSTYQAVDAEITKAAQPLTDAFEAVKPVLSTLGDVTKEMAHLAGGAFVTIENDIKWVADKISGAEKTARSIAESLAPVRWILDVAESTIEKVIKPILKKIEDITGISALEKHLVDYIKQKLGMHAIEEFNKHNATGKGKKTDAFGKNQNQSGSKNADALKNLWGSVDEALRDYKRGDKASAVEVAVEALLGALISGEIDPNAMPPTIRKKTIDFYIPDVTKLPSKAILAERADELRGTAVRVKARRPLHVSALVAAANTAPTAQAQAIINFAREITDGLEDPAKSLSDLNAAADAAITAMTRAASGIVPATMAVSQISSYSGAPPRAQVEIGAIATIATSIDGIVSRLIRLDPSTTHALAKAAPYLRDLTTRLNALAAHEAAISQVLAGADAQVTKTLSQINSIAQLPAHANAIAAIAASGATVAQLLSMLEELNVILSNAYDQDLAWVHAIVEKGAAAQTATFNGLVQDVANLGVLLQSIEAVSGNVLSYYQGVAQWGAPVSGQWLPILIDGAKCANAIDSILTPLSYLAQAVGCGGQTIAEQDNSIIDIVRSNAMAAAKAIYNSAIFLVHDIMSALPDMLEKVTADALKLSQMEALVAGARINLGSDLDSLVRFTGDIETALATIAAGTKTPQTYSWTYTEDGKQKTISISNVFFSEADARTIGTLATTMIEAAIGKGLSLPNASPHLQKERI